jgi:SecD/SecF fusion protein
MQNRGAIWTFTILLTVACLYQLSFSWVTKGLENKAVKHAKTEWDKIANSGDEFVVLGRDTLSVRGVDGSIDLKTEQTATSFYETSYVSEHADDPIYPVFGLTYRQCNDQKLGTGLDLQGGMSVTLEISIEDLVLNKAGNSPKPAFRQPYEKALKEFGEGKSDDFIGLFEDAYNSSEYAKDQMTFFSVGDKENFSLENSNDQMIAKLRVLAAEAIDNTEKIIETRINRFGVSQPSIQKQPISGRLHIELPGAKDKERVRRLLQSRAELGFWLGNQVPLVDALTQLNESLKSKEDADVIEEFDAADLEGETVVSEEIAAVVPDSLKQDSTTLEDSTDISGLELEDETNDSTALAAETNGLVGGPLFDMLDISQGNGVAYIGMAKSVDTAKINLILNGEEAGGLMPEGVFFRWSNSNNEGKGHTLYALEATKNGKPLLNGDDISNAAQDYDQQESEVVVTVGMTAYGSSEWETITTNNVGRITAIILDDEVYSAPVINQPIAGGQTRISGDFTIPEAQDLATVLVAGSYDTPAKIVDEAVVGPTLGEANIQAGMWSFIAALILVLLYMIVYYGKAGVVASIALIANIFFLLGALASLGAQLTLPGIAGLVLTLGMSVDANVLIFERIREELREGKGVKLAIKDGYKHAYSAIIDANITSLLTAVVLAYFGTGPIQGFATTLIVGVFTSLFSSILLTRLIFSYLTDRNSNVTFSRSFSENMFANMDVDFVGKRKKYYLVSIVVVLVGIISLVSIGLDKSVEFTGGRVYRVEFNGGEAPTQDAIAEAVAKYSIENEVSVRPEIKTVNNAFTMELTTKFLYTDVSKDATKKVDSVMNLGFTDAGYVASANAGVDAAKTYEIIQQRSVNPQISDELILGSFMAIIFSLIVIFAYIAFRFNRMTFGIGALIAMFHDVLVVLGLFSILYKVMPFSMQIDQAFIAAILTVVGYSINDTVVVFDRIREYITLHRRDEQNAVINKALNSTLSRTLNTSLTTFLVLLVIFIFGGESIKGFSFALMIGVIVGTYSSIFIATPSVIDLSKGSLMPKKSEDK